MASEKLYAFSQKDAARISRTVRAHEGGGGGGSVPSGGSGDWNPGILRARVTTAIPTGTMASPSNSGRVRIRHKLLDGSWDEQTEDLAVYNDHTYPTSVAANKAAKVAWIDGDLWLISADC